MPDLGTVPAIISPSGLSGALRDLLSADDLLPGDSVSYQLCKAIFISHPLGNKMAESPIRLAQSQEREITVPDSPEEDIIEEFLKQWEELEASRLILNVMTQARIYGIASVAMGEVGNEDDDPSKPVDIKDLWKKELFFNILDPLNTAGSLITSQNPNSPLYQKWGDLFVGGTRYHRSRTCTMMNEEALYIAYTASAFGFVGRSVYQRALYPLKSFVQSMITDDMVTRKAGLIVARLEQSGSIVDRIMQSLWGMKRAILQQGRTDNVLTIGKEEIIETLNMRNVNDSMDTSRNNIIKNVATAADMPAKLLTQESFVEGFGEGTQDAYAVAQYVDRTRIEMRKIYKFFDVICQYRAWNPEFYKTIQKRYPDSYGNTSYDVAFYRWRSAFRATWPSLIKEKPSEAVDLDKVRLEALSSAVQILLPELDPENKARLIQTYYDMMNAQENLFGAAKFDLDAETLADFLMEKQEQAQAMQEQGGEEGDEDPEGEKEPKLKPPKPKSLGRSDDAGVIKLLAARH